MELQPGLHVRPPDGATRAVVVLLHGGKEHSFEQADPMHLTAKRMRPFARALHQQGAAHGVAVWTVKYRVRGWNGAQMSPVQDARWALQQVRDRHGEVPVALVGHSMGGRVAVHVLGDPNVVAMVALAPWLPHEPVQGAQGRAVLVAHGTLDSRTKPEQSRAWAEQARPLARSMTYVLVRRSGHFLLRRARLWTDLTVGFTLKNLGLNPSIGRAATKVLAQAAAGATTLTV